jgi:hypothetical protein
LLGTYLHEEPMPEPLCGHTFVAIEDPGGARQAWGFSPAEFSRYDPHRDVAKLRADVPGRVHDDAGAFDRPGVKIQRYSITEAQAKAARAKVREYESGRYRFNLDQRQCATFVLDVMRAAELPVPEAGAAPTPRVMYDVIGGDG